MVLGSKPDRGAAALTEAFCGFPQFIQENDGMVLCNRPRLIHSNFPIRHSHASILYSTPNSGVETATPAPKIKQ
jgi:hypothetical protein